MGAHGNIFDAHMVPSLGAIFPVFTECTDPFHNLEPYVDLP